MACKHFHGKKEGNDLFLLLIIKMDDSLQGSRNDIEHVKREKNVVLEYFHFYKLIHLKKSNFQNNLCFKNRVNKFCFSEI